MDNQMDYTSEGLDIAVIGMAGRFPEAKNIHEFWENLKKGKESITFFSDQELEEEGIDIRRIKDPRYVKAKGVLEGIEYFDAPFFEYTAEEAEIMDPQMRIFHECIWEGLEDSGYDPDTFPGLIGLYAGASVHNEWFGYAFKLGAGSQEAYFSSAQLMDKDFVTTRISYKLNLKGPSTTIFSACSTSLVAVHQACQGLLSGESQMALAGGVYISAPKKSGYLYNSESIHSPDGHCRPFDIGAKGTVFGNGVGIVVLKQLEDALDQGDHIYAIIKGTAINNDGRRKVGYTAPSIKGQAEVIQAAHQAAEIEPETMGYIEAHGTGTTMGDPIEVEALKQAYNTEKKGYCRIGSLKANVGHLDIAAGVAGLIKTVLMLKHKEIPPSINYKTPNPEIDFENSPFKVNTELVPWTNDHHPLRAGVSSFGVGGTNAHVILEEAPTRPPTLKVGGSVEPPHLHVNRDATTSTGSFVVGQDQCRGEVPSPIEDSYLPIDEGGQPRDLRHQAQITPKGSPKLLLLSAKTPAALGKIAENLAQHLKDHRETDLEDTAFTLQEGRSAFDYRKYVVCLTQEEAIQGLSQEPSENIFRVKSRNSHRRVVFMFPGQGAQYENMGKDLYQQGGKFREEMDRCFEILEGIININIKEILYPTLPPALKGGGADAPHAISDGRGGPLCPPSNNSTTSFAVGEPLNINDTRVAQPLIFIFEYALARHLMHWGIQPEAMIGHSIGEYVAACLSGIFSLEQALELVTFRGQLMQQEPAGTMLSVPLSEEQLKPLMEEKLSIAAVNSPRTCVVSGKTEILKNFAEKLKEKGYESRELHTSHAFHSEMMEPVLEPFRAKMNTMKMGAPTIPFISNVTGTWITAEERQTKEYWVQHIRSTVQFSKGIKELIKEENTVFIEAGPGRVLSALTRHHNDKNQPTINWIVDMVRHPHEQESDTHYLMKKIGYLWSTGLTINWEKLYGGKKNGDQRKRLPLPTYPFEGQRYWAAVESKPTISMDLSKREMEQWFYVPTWKRHHRQENVTYTIKEENKVIDLVFMDTIGYGEQLAEELEKKNHQVIQVLEGEQYQELKENQYTLEPAEETQYHQLIQDLIKEGKKPGKLIHLWGIHLTEKTSNPLEALQNQQEKNYYSLLSMARAIGRSSINEEIQLNVVTNNMQEVVGNDLHTPLGALTLGPIGVIQKEFPNIKTRSIDISLPPGKIKLTTLQTEQIVEELIAPIEDQIVAYRGPYRWTQDYQPIPLNHPEKGRLKIKEKGVYLITGGLGGIGYVFAEHLAKQKKVSLVLINRTELPREEEWEQWIQDYGTGNPVTQKIEKVKKLKELGAEVGVYKADVTDPEQMKQVIQETKTTFGKIKGVIHTAGSADGGLIQLRTKELSEKILAPKIKGTLLLDYLLKEEKLDFIFLCSSILSVLAPMGQVAYSAANSFLDAYANHRNHQGGTLVQSVNWGIWREVGMAAATTPTEIKYIDISHPILDKKTEIEPNFVVFLTHLKVKKHWFLDEHRVMGSAIVLGTVYVELARAAYQEYTGHYPVEIRNVCFLNPLMVGDNEELELRVILKKRKKNDYEFIFLTAQTVGQQEWKFHARGEIHDIPPVKAQKYNLKEIQQQCNQEKVAVQEQGIKPYEGGFIEVGPRWDCLVEAEMGHQEGLALFQLPEAYKEDLKEYGLHPALLDFATSYLAMIHKNVPKGGYLPFSYKRMRVLSPLPSRIYCHSTYRPQQSQENVTLCFDIILMDEEGRELVNIEAFTLLTVMDEGKTTAEKIRAQYPLPGFVSRFSTRKNTSSAGYNEEALKSGITPQEGVEVLDRVLGAPLAQVLVSPQDLGQIMKQQKGGVKATHIQKEKETGKTGQKLERQDLSTTYAAPRNETEQKLTKILTDYLGIDKVGINDNFFELGATSLDMVQVTKPMGKAIDREIPLVAMFSYPSIKELGKYMEQEQQKTTFSDAEKERLEKKNVDQKRRLQQRKKNVKGRTHG
jgi:acyl transferase domain-containing protein